MDLIKKIHAVMDVFIGHNTVFQHSRAKPGFNSLKWGGGNKATGPLGTT